MIKNYRLIKVKRSKNSTGRDAYGRPAFPIDNSLLRKFGPNGQTDNSANADGNWDEVSQIRLGDVEQDNFIATLDGLYLEHIDFNPSQEEEFINNKEESLSLDSVEPIASFADES